MNTYNAEHIKDLSFFNKNVYLDKKFLLLIPETPLTAELKAILNEWDFLSFILTENLQVL